MKIAVTGAAGTIGTRLCEDLARDNDVVRIDITGVPSAVDVLKLDELERAIKGCETLIHLAGVVKVKASWEETRENLEGTYNAFEAARRVGCKRLIFASSNHAVGMYEADLAPGVYEPASGTLLTNTTPFRPDGLYGVWKCFGENLGRYYSDEYGMQVACLRIGGIRTEDTPTPGDVKNEATWLNISDEDKRRRMRAIWMSHRDLAGLVRAIISRNVPYGVVYGVSDNATRFWDLEAGRTLYGFWPVDGVK
ncbi:MAG: NAD(P)-dependent oxidoreductase [Vulcanimicrobiaceae bacterium]|jgi:nucleoside-diphosphate-sugar epimerase